MSFGDFCLCAVIQKPDANGGRMLMLELTDGAVKVKGMEYQSLPAVNVGLPPGTKVSNDTKASFK
jgi:hypothetical protein